MTTEDLVTRLREAHVEEDLWPFPNICGNCESDWPCDMRLLLDDRDQWREKAELAQNELGLHMLNKLGQPDPSAASYSDVIGGRQG